MAEQHEKALVPQIRFTGFTDPWEQRKLGELSNEFKSGEFICADNVSVSGSYPVYGGNGLRGYTTTFNHEGLYTLIGRQGALCGNVNIADGKSYFTEHAVAVKANHLNDTTFLYYLFGTLDLGQYSGQSAQPGLAVSNLVEVEAMVPDKAEQKKISRVFKTVDSLITLHQRKYDKLCVLKKSMLDKMFPKGGSLYPEIRFAGFTDPWEQRKLGEVASGFEYGLNAAASDFDGEKKYLRITDIDDQTREFRTDDLSSPDINNPIDDRYLLKEGDILFARTGASVGKTYLYKASDGKTYYAGFLIRAHVSDEADAGFIFQSTLTERYKQFVLLTSQRSGQPGINAQEYSDLLLPLPSLMEQRRIGAFFDRLDSLITLHQRKLELLRNIKKSMLDKMFV